MYVYMNAPLLVHSFFKPYWIKIIKKNVRKKCLKENGEAWVIVLFKAAPTTVMLFLYHLRLCLATTIHNLKWEKK